MALINQAVLNSRFQKSHFISLSSVSLHGVFSRYLCPSNRSKVTTFITRPYHICGAMTNHEQSGARRTAKYDPTSWDYSHMQLLTSGFSEKEHKEEHENMMRYVKDLIKASEANQLVKLELIDVIQRLGLQYQFKAEINHELSVIHESGEDPLISCDLYATALRFRLLRQHGYNVPQDAFKRFMDGTSSYRELLCHDVDGILNLYEASFLGMKGEMIMDKAMEFSGTCLKTLEKNKLHKRLAIKVDHALDMPLHWRSNRLEARWFIAVYEEEPNKNPNLLKLAKLDYNLVQATYMNEVGKVARWWDELGLNKMSFFRDRLLEHYLWSALIVPYPKYKSFRVMNTMIASMITVIDDVYDVYGLPEELELLTDFIDRWDISGIDKLPQVIKTCFLALYNTTNDIGYQTMMEQGINIIPYLRKAWADQCKAYLIEAKWYHKGLKPSTLNEYLDNSAVATIGGMIMLLCCFFSTTDTLKTDALDSISIKPPGIMLSSTLILRLNNDLGTSMHELARGDVLKAVECYMHETGHSTEAAREYIKDLVRETWKTMNADMAKHDSRLSETFIDACLDLARASQCFYQYGDGHGLPDGKTKEHLNAVLLEPVPIDH